MKLSHTSTAKLGALRLAARLAILRVAAVLLRRELIVVTLIEHFGDIVACEPVVGHLRKNHRRPWLVWVCTPRYAELVRHHPGIDFVATVPCLTSWIIARRFSLGHRHVDLHLNGRSCPVCRRALANHANPSVTMANYYDLGSLQEAFTLAAGLPSLNEQPTIHFPGNIDAKLASLGLPRDYVVVHAKSNEAERDWPLDRWPELARKISGKFGLAVIEIGLVSVLTQKSEAKFTNLCGQLSLLETARVIQQARIFIGIDSGPAQLANAVQCPGIILLGKYRTFSNQMPYSGFYRNGGATILRTNGGLDLIPVSEITAAVGRSLAHPHSPRHHALQNIP